MSTLWNSDDIAAATGGVASDAFSVSGVTFDSREVGPGDLFIALKGETTDGHRFLDGVRQRGAAGAVVAEDTPLPHVLVDNGFAALEALGRAGRARTAAKVIGVTGSVGKTGTKEALWAALDRGARGRVHKSVKSYNNHTGVPLSLSRMPADTEFAVLEMGMNHPGELAHLTTLVRPHVALVTAIAPAHTAFFPNEAAIADAKGEIFRGLEPGGTAILPYDSPHRDRLIAAAQPYAGRIVSFGFDAAADVHAIDVIAGRDGGTFVACRVERRELSFTIAQPGRHWVSNALAVIAAVDAVGGDLARAGLALAELDGLTGRGARSLVAVAGGEALMIDESYNANPASMRATLAVLAAEAGRKVVVLGDMRELGERSRSFHAELAAPIREAGVAIAILVGSEMEALAEALEGKVDFVHVPDAAAARERLADILAPGDVVLVKGSNGIGLSAVVAAFASGKK